MWRRQAGRTAADRKQRAALLVLFLRLRRLFFRCLVLRRRLFVPTEDGEDGLVLNRVVHERRPGRSRIRPVRPQNDHDPFSLPVF